MKKGNYDSFFKKAFKHQKKVYKKRSLFGGFSIKNIGKKTPFNKNW
jgi:hypothetical protein